MKIRVGMLTFQIIRSCRARERWIRDVAQHAELYHDEPEPRRLRTSRSGRTANFSTLGYMLGVCFISMRNIAPRQLYEISYPKSGMLHQVFPYTRRRSLYGMDRFSIQQ